MCQKEFIRLKIIEPQAHYRCQSLYYENMETFATIRNGRIECGDQSDEALPKDFLTILLVSSTIIIIIFYITLKYSGLAKRMISADNQKIALSLESDKNLYQNFLDYNTLKKYGENHNQNEAIEIANVHILNSIHTQKVDKNIDTCKLFYQLEQEIHESNQSEIHLCLHRKLDPKVVENILDAGEPGCTASCVKGFENCLGRRLITGTQNKITTTPIIKEFIATIIGINKIVAKFTDLIKDIALSLVILQFAGGSSESIWNFRTNFYSVLVITTFSSIL